MPYKDPVLQRNAVREWAQAHPGYYAKWRKEHPEYDWNRWTREHPDWKREYDAAWWSTPNGQVLRNRHRWPDTPTGPMFFLNEKSPGSHMHHVEERIGVFIPGELHRSVPHCLTTGEGMVEINELVANFLTPMS